MKVYSNDLKSNTDAAQEKTALRKAVRRIRRKHSRAVIGFGAEGVRNAVAVFGKRPDPPPKTDGAA